jgi:predicted metal-dependent hydrolase
MASQLAFDFASTDEPLECFEPVLIRHPRARRYVVRVRADGSVRVTIPRGGSRRQALAFAAAEREWILRQRARVADERRQQRAPIAPEAQASQWAQAKLVLPVRLAELAARFDLTVARVSVRNQRWRWGSCSPNGHICLNWRLVRMPEWIRDYVLIHELMHLKRLDHSPRFWRLVAAACPEYEQARGWLRQFGRVEVG